MLHATGAAIVLSTSHRVNYDITNWKQLFHDRGLTITALSKINTEPELNPKENRADEILKWINSPGSDKNYVIIDDDTSLHALPEAIKERWVRTSALIGFNAIAFEQAIQLLMPAL